MPGTASSYLLCIVLQHLHNKGHHNAARLSLNYSYSDVLKITGCLSSKFPGNVARRNFFGVVVYGFSCSYLFQIPVSIRFLSCYSESLLRELAKKINKDVHNVYNVLCEGRMLYIMTVRD